MTENEEDKLIAIIDDVMGDGDGKVTIMGILSDQLLKLPKEIHTLELSLIKQQGKLDAVKLKIRNWELTEMQQITSAQVVADEGKKTKAMYPNESARKAALERHKDGHDGYGAMENEHRELKISLDKAKADLTYKHNRFSAIRNIAKMVAGILREG